MAEAAVDSAPARAVALRESEPPWNWRFHGDSNPALTASTVRLHHLVWKHVGCRPWIRTKRVFLNRESPAPSGADGKNKMERAARIELASSAWKAEEQPLSQTRSE